MARRGVTLDDKYDLAKDRVFLSGTQAIVRLALMQKERDRRAGLNTAGFVSGYRGSPLGGLDQQFWRAEKHLKASDIVFQPGLNEDLAATAVWGSQQAGDARRGPLRRRLRHLVRQGAGRRPQRRRAPPRQFRRHLAAWRRPRADGRRPHLRKLHHRASVGVRLRRRDDADPQSRRPAGDRRLRAYRLGAVALRRRLGRHQVRQGQRRIDRRRSTARSIACGRSSRTSPCRPAG